jgi:hypothetical protein
LEELVLLFQSIDGTERGLMVGFIFWVNKDVIRVCISSPELLLNFPKLIVLQSRDTPGFRRNCSPEITQRGMVNSK